MRLYILRHGTSEDAGPGSDDRKRALTEEGRKEVRDVIRAAKRAKMNPDLILSSPYVRAKQTAKIAAEILDHEEIVESNLLTPGGEVRDVWNAIREHRDAGEILLVGHDPLFSSLVGYLLGSQAILVDMKKGALARVDFENFAPHPHGVLKWMIVPRLAA